MVMAEATKYQMPANHDLQLRYHHYLSLRRPSTTPKEAGQACVNAFGLFFHKKIDAMISM